MKRRDFLKATVGGTAATLYTTAAQARPNLEPAPQAMGMLYDATLCVGCKACVSMCKEVNEMPPEIDGDDLAWDSARDLSDKTLNVIKVYTEGEGKIKDTEINGYSFEKRSCMHCVDPGCVSVCPTTAMRQDKVTGIVTHHPDVCVGCRNCMVGCPYNVPQYEYNKLYGQIRKCELCNQKGVERIDKGQMTGCAEVCPTGSTLFGPREALLQEAKRRMALKPGEIYKYPMGDITKPYKYHEKEVPTYQQHIWGEKEAGGTSVMHIAAIPFDKLGMPPLEERSASSVSETVQKSVYNFMALPALALAGLTYTIKRNIKDDDEGGEK